MTDEKVVQLAEKHRIAGSDGALAAIREAYDVGRRDGLEEAAKATCDICREIANGAQLGTFKPTAYDNGGHYVEGYKMENGETKGWIVPCNAHAVRKLLEAPKEEE